MRVALSFDNGPTPGVTEAVVDLLGERGLPATFFVVGAKLRDPAAGRAAARVAAAGHRIGNHTLDHAVPLGAIDDPAEVVRQIDEAQELLGPLAGDELLFRPYGDGGALDERLLGPVAIEHLRRRGYTCVLWDVVPGDWKDPDGWVERGLAEVASRQHPLVVLHDTPTGALPRLAEFLDRAVEGGAEFTPELPPSCLPIVRGRPTDAFDRLEAIGTT